MCLSLLCNFLLFQHTAARRRLAERRPVEASRTCFNTQPLEGGWAVFVEKGFFMKCFNTQPLEGGWLYPNHAVSQETCFNTQPLEGGWNRPMRPASPTARFQHTAARRRLAVQANEHCGNAHVSTHSRSKAAGGLHEDAL